MDALLLSQSAAPTLDGDYWIMFASRVLHTTCGATILGGLFYLRLVCVPRVEPSSDPSEICFGDRRATWARWIAIATVVLLATGLYNYFAIRANYERLPPSYHMLFGIKFLVALPVFFIAAILAGRTALATRMRQQLRFWLNVGIVLTVVVFALGAAMRSFDKVRKTVEPGEPIPIVQPDG